MSRRETESDKSSRDDSSYENEPGLSPLAIGYAWVVRVTTLCFEIVALLLLGRFVDARFGTAPWGTISGAAIGIGAFVAGLISIARRLDANERTTSDSSDDEPFSV
ncbi:MAG: AtpZ/AtpI family protein [Thermoguttaceae bacterium]|nr:AtpZ/AtpI family protein [Thermoguttaceae bacterium]